MKTIKNYKTLVLTAAIFASTLGQAAQWSPLAEAAVKQTVDTKNPKATAEVLGPWVLAVGLAATQTLLYSAKNPTPKTRKWAKIARVSAFTVIGLASANQIYSAQVRKKSVLAEGSPAAAIILKPVADAILKSALVGLRTEQEREDFTNEFYASGSDLGKVAVQSAYSLVKDIRSDEAAGNTIRELCYKAHDGILEAAKDAKGKPLWASSIERAFSGDQGKVDFAVQCVPTLMTSPLVELTKN